jgi:O-antigen ligase
MLTSRQIHRETAVGGSRPVSAERSASDSLPMPVTAPATTLSFVQRIGYVLLICYIITVFGRLPEVLAQRLGTNLYLSAFLFGVVSLATLFSGNLRHVFTTVPGRFLLAYHAWLAVASPFSYWRMESLQTLGSMLRYFAFFFFVVSLLLTLKQCRGAMYAIAGSLFVIFLSIPLIGTQQEDRFSIGKGYLGNANELAAIVLMTLPFWAFIATSRRRLALLRVLAFVVILVGLGIVVKTGSRGGLIAAMGTACVMFWSYPFSTKLKMLAVLPVLAVTVLLVVPRASVDRFRTLVDDSSEPRSEAEGGAASSTVARKALLLESVKMTLRHPLLGVGVGVYAPAAAEVAAQEGRHANWQVAHNAYLQVSCEGGLPALVLYLGVLISLLRGLLSVRKVARSRPEMSEVADMASHIFFSLVVFCLYGMFTSVSTEFYFYILAGVAVAFTRIARASLESPCPVKSGTMATTPGILTPSDLDASAPREEPPLRFRSLRS